MRKGGLLCGLVLFCDGFDLELQACLLLKAVDDRKKDMCVKTVLGCEHLHQAIGRFGDQFAQLLKTDGRPDIIVQHRSACAHFAFKQALEHDVEQFGAESRLALYALLDRFPRRSR